MKFKANPPKTGGPDALREIFTSEDFAEALLTGVVRDVFGVQDVLERPGEYSLQESDFIVPVGGKLGLVMYLTCVSRSTGRANKVFHKALKELHRITKQFLQRALVGSDDSVHFFCVVVLDGDIEATPGEGNHTRVLESKAEWVKAASDDEDEDAEHPGNVATGPNPDYDPGTPSENANGANTPADNGTTNAASTESVSSEPVVGAAPSEAAAEDNTAPGAQADATDQDGAAKKDDPSAE